VVESVETINKVDKENPKRNTTLGNILFAEKLLSKPFNEFSALRTFFLLPREAIA